MPGNIILCASLFSRVVDLSSTSRSPRRHSLEEIARVFEGAEASIPAKGGIQEKTTATSTVTHVDCISSEEDRSRV